jgi:hypothetical protein
VDRRDDREQRHSVGHCEPNSREFSKSVNVKGDDDITRGVYRNMCSRCRDVVVGGHVFEMGNRWEKGKGDGEEGKGGRSVHK